MAIEVVWIGTYWERFAGVYSSRELAHESAERQTQVDRATWSGANTRSTSG